MGERRGTKGLELWCRRMTEGYPGVNVVNMTTSWRDGLAFCAIIHHFRPDLIEFSKLNKDDIYHNNELAFRIAERHLGIPALLEPEDMVEFPVPDRLSILTYLSQFYQTFGVGQGKSPTRIAPKRPTSSPDHDIVSPASTSPPSKMAFSSAGKMRREPCAKCNLPVFIAERLNVGKLLYHRTCFRCARCDSQLTLANYYETENNEFCCETCPDEEKPSFDQPDTSSVLTRSLSDEEKSASLKKSEDTTDEYSAKFETALEFADDGSLRRNSTLNSSQFANARSQFMNTQVDDINSDSGSEDEPPDLPSTKPPINIGENERSDSGFPSDEHNTNVNIDSKVSLDSTSDNLEKSHDVVTKDAKSAEGDTISLVKARMRLFETKSDTANETHSVNDKVPSTNSCSENRKEDDMDDVENANHSFKDNILNKNALEETDDSVITISDTSVLHTSEEIHNSVITISDSQAESVTSGETSDNKIEHSRENSSTNDDQSTLQDNNRNESNQVSFPEAIKEYPDDLNPFGDDTEVKEDNVSVTSTNASLNPFDDDDNDDDDSPVAPSIQPALRKRIQASAVELSPVAIQRISVNPFEDAAEVKMADKPQPAKRKITAPRITLNPFWSDEEDKDRDGEFSRPVPKPRNSKSSVGAPESKQAQSGLSTNSSTFSSLSSVSSSQSGHVTLRKKKPAPKPPNVFGGSESGHSSLTSSPSQSVTHSPRATPKVRKAKKAPLPPTSTPLVATSARPNLDFFLGDEFEKEKSAKDEVNRNRQSSQNGNLQSPSSSENSSSLGAPDKSTYGKWKRRKGLAPSRPIPQRRTVKSLPMTEVRRELELIEMQQQGLEKQGVRLEQIIREKCEGPNVNPDESLPPEIEDMILQLFELVNEKNELFRRQAELMYLRRQHKLEEEHADIEYQIRCLMLQPEVNKTDSDKAREEELISRLVEIVERRNEIIECLEMDRVREAEEDDGISNQLNVYTMKKEQDKTPEKKSSDKKDKKKHKKEKKLKLKGHKVDADKDIDESDTSATVVKDKKKKKFNIF